MDKSLTFGTVFSTIHTTDVTFINTDELHCTTLHRNSSNLFSSLLFTLRETKGNAYTVRLKFPSSPHETSLYKKNKIIKRKQNRVTSTKKSSCSCWLLAGNRVISLKFPPWLFHRLTVPDIRRGGRLAPVLPQQCTRDQYTLNELADTTWHPTMSKRCVCGKKSLLP